MPRGSRLRSISFRISEDLAARLKEFIAKNSSRPSYLTPHQFAEEAIVREIERLAAKYESDGDKSPPVAGRRINDVPVHSIVRRT